MHAFAVGLAIAAFALAASAASASRHALTRDQLPEGFAVGSGDPPLALKLFVEDGRVAAVTVANAATANVLATRGGDDGRTTLNLHTDLDVALKFDLYVSRDGRTFEYTSTCAVTPGISGFEMWEYPVREFALGNPRVVPQGKMPCD